MAKKKKELDRLTLISIAAEKEGLSYGKYMVKYNYNPPCLEGIQEESLGKDRRVARNLVEEDYIPEKPKKQCIVCGEWFQQKRKDQICCGGNCQYERAKARDREKHLAGKEQRYCEICGKPLKLSVSAKVFTCSPECSKERDKKMIVIRNREYREKARMRGK